MEPDGEPVSETTGITSPQMGCKSYTLPIIMRPVVLRPVACPSLEGILEPWERESSLSLEQSRLGSKQLMAAYCSSDELWVSRSILVILGIERLQTSFEQLPTPLRADTIATMFPSAPGSFLVMELWCSFYSTLNISCTQHQSNREWSWGPGVLNHPASRAQLPALTFLNSIIACGVFPDMKKKTHITNSMAFPGPFDWLESRVANVYEAGLTGLDPEWGDWENTGLEVSPPPPIY